MGLKRTVTWDAPTPKKAKTLTTKVSRIQRQLAERKPEMKHRTLAGTGTITTGTIVYIEISELAQGSDTAGREGSQIKLHYTEYRVTPYVAAAQQAGLDVYLLTTKADNVPAYSQFGAVPGGFPDRRKFIEWNQHCTSDDSNNGNIHGSYSWQFPMKCHYEGSAGTAGTRNLTFLVLKNDTGASINYGYASRTFYTDI